MSMLTSLNAAYERMADRGELPPMGYSQQRIGFWISLEPDGTPALPPIDLRDGKGKKMTAPYRAVPQPVKRTSGIAPNFLWDKTSYVLGVTAGDDKRLEKAHAEFKRFHQEHLADTQDAGLRAFLSFLSWWTPARFAELGWPEDMLDQNIVFSLESERRDRICLHDRPAARTLWARMAGDTAGAEAICLITGERAPIADLHPSIKGVWGGQTAGASIVSFNLDAFTSYGHRQGENAPVSAAAAFGYTSALNAFLASGSRNRVQIGDTSTVFWAEAAKQADAEVALAAFAAMVNGDGKTDASDAQASTAPVDETSEAAKVGHVLDAVRRGKPLADFAPGLQQGVRFYVLGLAPNAARISIRFWFEGDFGTLAKRYARFVEDMSIDPPWHKGVPGLWHYLLETATLHKRENIPPNLAGDWLRAILSGTRYPQTLLSTVLMRIRADKSVNVLRAAMLKAVLCRNHKMEVPVAFDPDFSGKGYLLGRLFAVYEETQRQALGSVNASIKDKFYGAASAQPRKVFPMLDHGSASHLSKLGKMRAGSRVNREKEIAEIMGMMTPGEDPFPSSLPSEQQGLFTIGYYHQRQQYFKSPKDANKTEQESDR